jgi:hypothetical protein
MQQIESERQRALRTLLTTRNSCTALLRRVHADENNKGFFWLKSPDPRAAWPACRRIRWTVLNADFREVLLDKEVKPDHAAAAPGEKKGPWEVELKIPQKHVGQVLCGLDHTRTRPPASTRTRGGPLVAAEPTRIYKGNWPSTSCPPKQRPTATTTTSRSR